MKIREKTFRLYWYFAAERQAIFYKKQRGDSAPWTDDPILQTYKFCNCYRVNDRVSQYLLNHVIYNGKQYSDRDMMFRILLFKLFNKESTWELLERTLGDITLDQFSIPTYSAILHQAMDQGIAIYNDAYISCANKAFGFDCKCDNHLALLYKMFVSDHLDQALSTVNTMEEGYHLLLQYPLIGKFMAYQLITDLNYSPIFHFSESEFTVAGPGAVRDIQKCFIDRGSMTNEEIIQWMCDHQEDCFEHYGFSFKPLHGRRLQYIDCQNLFCEVDKYCRQAVPELTSNRTKIKKQYRPKSEPIAYVYPPKWNLPY